MPQRTFHLQRLQTVLLHTQRQSHCVPVQFTCWTCWQRKGSAHLNWILTVRGTCHAHSQLCRLRCSADTGSVTCSIHRCALCEVLCCPVQGLQGFLVQWRTGRIKNPSAYLTDLLGRAYQDNLLADHDPLPFIDVPASRFTTVCTNASDM